MCMTLSEKTTEPIFLIFKQHIWVLGTCLLPNIILYIKINIFFIQTHLRRYFKQIGLIFIWPFSVRVFLIFTDVYSGKILFANFIFNGYGTSAKDLQKQTVKTRSDYHMGCFLPSDFRVR